MHKTSSTFLLLLLLFVTGMAGHAQNTIKGVLTDAENGEAVPFANVMLQGTQLGSATDLNGFFLINRIPDGTYVIQVRYVGYEDYFDTLQLAGKQTLKLNIQLRTEATKLDAVEIVSKRSEERRQQTQVSVEKISAAQIQQMPSIGGQSDIAQYMQVLPGVNSTGDQGGQLYIRGGSMIQNLCLLDGMIVYNPFHSIGLYSIFETDVILNADIYTGGFGAEYGGRISSVMDIKTRDGNKKRHTGKVGLSTFGANLTLEGPLKKEKPESQSTLTYLFTAKNSYLSRTSDALYPYVGYTLPFDFLDLYGKVSLNSGTGSKFSLFGFRFDDNVIGYQSIADYHWRNVGAGGNFVLITGTSALIDGAVAYSSYNIALEDQSNSPKTSDISGFNMNMGITNFYGRNKLRYGISLEGYSTDYQFMNEYNVPRSQAENTTQFSAFVTYHMQREKLVFDPGFRYVQYTSLSEGSPEPRLALKYMVSDRVRLKFAGGMYSQVLLDARSDHDIVNLFNGFLTGSGYLNLPNTFQGKKVETCVQKAQHLVAGLEVDPLEHLTMNVEVYLKNFSQLLSSNHHQLFDNNDPVYKPGGLYEKPETYLTDFIIEKGYATGVDLSLCYDADRLYLWATYSLGYVRRRDDVQTYAPHYDRRHTINLLANYSLGQSRKWEVSGRWSFGSGFPFTETMGVYEQLPFRNGMNTDYWNENGIYGVQYGEIYKGRMPWYHRLDLGVKRRFSIGKRSIMDVNLSVTNVYNRENIFYVGRFNADDRVNQLPIMASAGINISF